MGRVGGQGLDRGAHCRARHHTTTARSLRVARMNRARQAIAAERFRQLPPDTRRLVIEALRRAVQGIPVSTAFDQVFAGELPKGVQP